MQRSTKEKLIASSLIVGLWLIIGTLAYGFLLFPQIHQRLADALHDDQPSGHTDVTLVAIDQKSLEAVGQGGLGRWQDWQRAYYATVIENLEKAGARVIGVDVFFSEPNAEGRAALLQQYLQISGQTDASGKAAQLAAADDAALKKTLQSHDNVIVAANVAGTNDVLLPSPAVTGTGTMIGSVTLAEDADNVLRRVPLWTGNAIVAKGFAFSLFLAWTGAAEDDFARSASAITYTGQPLRDADDGHRFPAWSFPTDSLGRILVRFRGLPFAGFPTLSFVDVYNNSFDPATVKGKAILIGEMDAGLHDDLYTPASFGQKRPGVEVHAHALQSLINNDTVMDAPIWMHALLTLAAVVLLAVVGIFLGPLWGLGVLVLLLLGTFGYSTWAFDTQRLIISVWYIGLALTGAYASILVYKIFLEQREKKVALRAFSHYVSDKVANIMVRNPSLLKLGGEKKVLSVTFTDIAGFTTLSEQLTPEQITDFLHIYLDTMTQTVLREDGTLDKYIGDAIMSIFGAPLYYEDHAKRACRAILAMHAAIPEVMRQLPLELPEGMTLAIRSGIATGEMVVGNFGSHKRFDYTVIGDTVNLSSRLEGANKQYHSQICVNEDTYQAAKDTFLFRSLDNIRVKGKRKPVRIYELMAQLEGIDRSLEAMVEDFERAFVQYQQRDFENAREAFLNLHHTYADGVSEIYMHRCAHYLENPPAATWDGVYTMETK